MTDALLSTGVAVAAIAVLALNVWFYTRPMKRTAPKSGRFPKVRK